MVDILHRIGATASQEDVYAALTTIDGLAGWWTEDTKAEGDAGEVGGIIRFRFAGAPEPGGFDMRVLEVTPAERVLWEVVEGPEEWVGTHVGLRAVPGGRLHHRDVRAHRLARGRAVHVPLQHQVGDVPDEPQGARRDGYG